MEISISAQPQQVTFFGTFDGKKLWKSIIGFSTPLSTLFRQLSTGKLAVSNYELIFHLQCYNSVNEIRSITKHKPNNKKTTQNTEENGEILWVTNWLPASLSGAWFQRVIHLQCYNTVNEIKCIMKHKPNSKKTYIVITLLIFLRARSLNCLNELNTLNSLFFSGLENNSVTFFTYIVITVLIVLGSRQG